MEEKWSFIYWEVGGIRLNDLEFKKVNFITDNLKNEIPT